MSNQTEWRWADPTGQQRLVREDELRAALATGVIPANAPVWTRGWTGWKPAHDVPELTGKSPGPTNGTSGDVPPPPTFVMAAKDAFEGKPKPVPSGPAEPPPPPRYVPVAANTQPHIPAAAGSDTKVDAPVVLKNAPAAPKKSMPPPLPPGANKTAPKKSTPPPLPPGARKPTPAAIPAVKPAAGTPATAKPVTKTAPVGTTTKPLPKQQQQQSAFTKTQRPPAGVAPPAALLSGPSSSRTTLQVVPAPPPMMPKLDPLPKTPEPPPAKEPSSKFPTLVMFDGNEPGPAQPAAANAEEAPPIVVPPPEPSEVKNAVTRPPPWGEGAVEVQTMFPKSPKVPDVERPSEAPRNYELSSSDLSSEARIEVVKAPPLAAVERPGHQTMLGIGPDALAENRAALERAVSPPPAPLSASDVAATRKVPAQDDTEPKLTAIPEPSGAKLHDLREMARQRMSGATDKARQAYADLRERTKDKPKWFLPAIGGGGALVLLILVIAGIKAVSGSSEADPKASASAGSSASAGGMFPSPTDSAKAPPARPMTCSTAGAARTVAPKAVVASGVEVTPVGNQIALGFAVAPKEATLEIVDASSLASASALHLKSNDNVRRVLALDASKAAVDADHKGDKLQGRRTVRGAQPIDLGAIDGGLAWAPHGSDKAIKLWSLANPDAPVEALRGEPLPNGKGYAVAFRHGGAIWFGAFGGSPPAPLAGLVKVDGLGPQIGSPALAVSGEHVMVAWADRAGTSDPWGVRWAMFRPGEEAAQAKPFTPPAGGLGDHVMSPGLASLGSGRFLLVWTEGPVSSHQVRGITVSDNGTFGDAFTASAEGVNAGQGQAAVLEGGRGVVAFLAGSGKTFEVAATPIQCVEK